MKILFYKIAFQFYSLMALLTKNKKLLKQKLLFGSFIIAIIAVSSCKTKTPPHKCYAPVMNDQDNVNNTIDTSPENTNLENIKKIDITG